MRGYTNLSAVTVTTIAWIMLAIHFLAQLTFFEASCAHTLLFQVLKYVQWQAWSKASAAWSRLKCFVCMVCILCRLTAASRISYITLAYRYMYSYTSVVQHIHTTMTVARTLVSIARPTMHQMMKSSSTVPRFPHPKHANGRYWRRVRNRRRKMWKQVIALYVQLITTDPNPIQDDSQSYQQHCSTSSKDTTHQYTTPPSTESQHTCQQWGGGTKRSHTDSYDCSSIYTPFSKTGTEWLSSNQIERGLLYLLHAKFQQAKHQNLQGTTHTTAANAQLIAKLREAGSGNQLEDVVGIAQVLRDTLDPTGPCPAIVVGDGVHFRNVLINSRTKTVSLVDPMGSGFSSDVKASIIDLYNKDNTGGWKISEWRVRMQHDSYSCGIWAIWIHEKWMQYWMLENTHITFEGSPNKYRTYQVQVASGNTTMSKCRQPWRLDRMANQASDAHLTYQQKEWQVRGIHRSSPDSTMKE